MEQPIVRIDFRKTVNKIRKEHLLDENALTNAINKGIRRSLNYMARYAKKHHKYKDWLERAVYENTEAPPRKFGNGNGLGLTRAIHFMSEKGKGNKDIHTGTLYINLKQAPWGKYQYFGTKAHGPSVARALVFFGRGSGGYPTDDKVVAKRVRGIEADPFLRDALNYYRKDVSVFINEAIKEAVNK